MCGDGDHHSDWRDSDGGDGNDHGGGMKDGSVLGSSGTNFLVGDVCSVRDWICRDEHCACLHGLTPQGQGKTRRNKINPLTCARGQRANEG